MLEKHNVNLKPLKCALYHLQVSEKEINLFNLQKDFAVTQRLQGFKWIRMAQHVLFSDMYSVIS